MKCPACKTDWHSCQCTFEACSNAIRDTTIEEIAKFALQHASMYATETACRRFVAMLRDKKGETK